jgi:hypothetical protein
MMGKRGKMKYVPVMVIDEVEDIMREESIVSNSEGFRRMVKHSQIGRELERIKNLNWSKKRKGGLF